MNTFVKINTKYKPYLKNFKFLRSVGNSFLILIASLLVNFYIILYVNEKASNFVTDIVLSNIRVFDLDGVFIYGPLIFWILIIALCLYKPGRIPFVVKSIALFVFIRSIFVSLTHIGPFPDYVPVDFSGLIGKLTSANDLFFPATLDCHF
jgi:hypothetical protein